MKFIIEFEGFQLTNIFVFKEVSIINLSTKETFHFFLKSPFSRKCLFPQEQKVVQYCETFLHKIKWFAGNSRMKDLYLFLNTIPTDSTIYTKGKQKVALLCKIISWCNIQDLEDFKCPAITKLSVISEIQCPLQFHRKTLNCSFRKASLFAEYMLNYKNE